MRCSSGCASCSPPAAALAPLAGWGPRGAGAPCCGCWHPCSLRRGVRMPLSHGASSRTARRGLRSRRTGRSSRRPATAAPRLRAARRPWRRPRRARGRHIRRTGTPTPSSAAAIDWGVFADQIHRPQLPSTRLAQGREVLTLALAAEDQMAPARARTGVGGPGGLVVAGGLGGAGTGYTRPARRACSRRSSPSSRSRTAPPPCCATSSRRCSTPLNARRPSRTARCRPRAPDTPRRPPSRSGRYAPRAGLARAMQGCSCHHTAPRSTAAAHRSPCRSHASRDSRGWARMSTRSELEGATAMSSCGLAREYLELRSEYAAKVPCRSRWSGAMFSSTAASGANASVSSS